MRRRIITIALGLAVFLAATFAWAAWTQTTSNNHASGKYGSLQGVVTVSATTTGGTDCFPGGTCTLYVRFSNPNPQAVTVSSIDGSAATFAGCTTPAASLSGFSTGSLYTNGGSGWAAPPGNSATFQIAGAVTIGSSPSNDCQGSTLDVGGLTVNTTT